MVYHPDALYFTGIFEPIMEKIGFSTQFLFDM